jgi:histone H3
MKSEAVTSNSLGELEVFGHDSHSLGVDGAEVGILKERNEVSFGSFLESKHCLALESNLLLELSRDLSHQALEGQLADQQISLTQQICTLFWNFLISRRATVPGLKRWGFLRPDGIGALFLAIF